jgi:ADP-glucose pyrophosphorylase
VLLSSGCVVKQWQVSSGCVVKQWQVSSGCVVKQRLLSSGCNLLRPDTGLFYEKFTKIGGKSRKMANFVET